MGGGSRTAGRQSRGQGESRGSEVHLSNAKPGDGGTGQVASRETERAVLLYFGFSCWALLNWDHKLYMIFPPSQNKCSFFLLNFVPQKV